MRIELANNGLLTLLSNNFTMSGVCVCVCSFVKIGLAWKSDRNMGDPVRIELANNGLLTLLSNNFTMSGVCVCVCSFVKIGLAWKSDRNMGDPVRIELANNGSNLCSVIILR